MGDFVKVEVEFPEDLLMLLRKSKVEMGEQIRKMVALQLFKDHMLSSGKAAEVAGVSISDFMDFTREHKVPWVEYTQEELEREIERAKKLAQRMKGKD